MSQTRFRAASWFQALTLMERANGLRRAKPEGLAPPTNSERAMRRLERWQSQAPFHTGSYFAERLAADGLTEDELRLLLGESAEAVQQRVADRLVWMADLERAFSRPPAALTLSRSAIDGETSGFLDAIEPIIAQGLDRLRDGIRPLARTGTDLPFDPETIEGILLPRLAGRLLAMLSRTMVLEVHVARLQGLLIGDTPEDRFRSFLERIRQRDVALTLLEEYPVLARQLVVTTDCWLTFSLEFLQHLCADWNDLRPHFTSNGDPGVLAALDGAGDTHRSGRVVLIATFTSGFKLVYKPRSLALDRHVQELLAWLNAHGAQPPFRLLNVLDRGDHGWVEFVLADSCHRPEEVRRFYERQGAYLALLYALDATDFHFENLIAAGEHPLLLDLEAFFHPWFHDPSETHDAAARAVRTIHESVLGIGMLPQRLWGRGEIEGIDISGFAAVEGQLTPFAVPYWEAAGTDEMRLDRKRVTLSGGHNRPTLNGQPVDARDYIGAVLAGFTNLYRLLMRHRDDLLTDDGPVARFAQDEVRVILRATQTYAVLLNEAFHPDVLRNALDRDRLFDRLWAAVPRAPYLARIIASERAELWNGDIPMFTTRPDSHDLWSGQGERVPGILQEPGLERVRRRLCGLAEDDLRRQLWLARASFASLGSSPSAEQFGARKQPPPSVPADRDGLLRVARTVGDQLGDLAVRAQDSATWIGLVEVNQRNWSIAPLGLDLYDGVPGVALFLAHLGVVTHDDQYTTLARAALLTLRRDVERERSAMRSIGGFAGWGGVIYTFAHLGVLWNQPDLLAEASELVDLVHDLIGQDEQLDVVGGAAGCIGGLLALHRCAPSDRILAAAAQCGDHLLSKAQAMEPGLGWVITPVASKPLTGFAHGAAGIAWALLELAAATGEQRFEAAARAAMEYERSLFSPEVGNWPDLRQPAADGDQPAFMVAWCHGAPGIGLARLAALRHLDKTELRDEVAIAARTTLADGFGANHSLCHGDLGNLNFLLEVQRAVGDGFSVDAVERVAERVLASIIHEGWRCGIPTGIESPGLMTGLAGIGYGLLRLAEPERIPDVLLLTPPIGAA